MIYTLTDSNGIKWQTQMVAKETDARPLYFIPHDKMRYDYDDREREHSQGWKYNPALTGRRRACAWLKSQPEVYRIDPWNGFVASSALVDLVCNINYEIPRDKALTLLGSTLAFCNGQFGRFDGPRLMGGWTVTAREDGNKLWVDTVDVDKPLPSAEEVLADLTKWGWCVSVRPDGLIGLWHRKGLDGTDKPVRMVIVSAGPVWIPRDEALRVYEVKDPQWMG